jgi:hypothetical protein
LQKNVKQVLIHSKIMPRTAGSMDHLQHLYNNN